MLDGEGTYRTMLYAGGVLEQPAIDMAVMDVVRSRWNELRNREMKDAIESQHRHKR
jgi:hypothetical protein